MTNQEAQLRWKIGKIIFSEYEDESITNSELLDKLMALIADEKKKAIESILVNKPTKELNPDSIGVKLMKQNKLKTKDEEK